MSYKYLKPLRKGRWVELLSPYNKHPIQGDKWWRRISLCQNREFSVWLFYTGRWAITLGDNDYFDYCSDAMHAQDKKLVLQGYTFLSQKQWDKLSVLV